MFNRFKVGDYVIIDPAGNLTLKAYDPVIGIIHGKQPNGDYVVTGVNPVLFPTDKEGYQVRYLSINKRYLKKYNGLNYVVRYPNNMPYFSYNDAHNLELLIKNLKLENKIASATVLSKILDKIVFYRTMINGGSEDETKF